MDLSGFWVDYTWDHLECIFKIHRFFLQMSGSEDGRDTPPTETITDDENVALLNEEGHRRISCTSNNLHIEQKENRKIIEVCRLDFWLIYIPHPKQKYWKLLKKNLRSQSSCTPGPKFEQLTSRLKLS